ncbi:MAG: phosphoadenylyl-sulfate reductase [Bacteroidales bacterium]|nr:phosphoadenylyl-sulfate reductase [Bacteroidales bacterium]
MIRTNAIMQNMDTSEIRNTILKFIQDGKHLFVTSSFQTQSIALLHIISQTDQSIPVYFINTGYHFPETIVHKNNVASLLGLNVIDLMPLIPKSNQRDGKGNLLFTFDPDYCCYVNKVQPVEPLLDKYDIWISGVRADQNQMRSGFQVFQPTSGRAVRYHPLLNWSAKDIDHYLERFDLPAHPLEKKGYKSIGCEPCTKPLKTQNNRDGRWYGMKKTECGLNTELNHSK